VADREYPMQVDIQEEEAVRNVGRQINQQIKSYREEFGIEDKQDLLAMFAVDCMMQKSSLETEKNHLESIIQQKIQQIDQLLDNVL
jgi:cell division protein ZapA